MFILMFNAMIQVLTGCFLGILLGMRHALEPDHLAAVSTLMAEERSPGRGALLGAYWGAGHSLSLLAVGVILAFLHAQVPTKVGDLFELGVALMLLGLGARSIRQALRKGVMGSSVLHVHGDGPHRHPGPPGHVHLHRFTFASRPLCVGMVHGLAGSGALTALVLAGLPSTATRLVYIALFGLGSIAGMALLSGLLGWPLARIGHGTRMARGLSAVTGTVSAGMGILWGVPVLLRLMA